MDKTRVGFHTVMLPPGKCSLLFEGRVEGEFDTQEEAFAAGEELVRLNRPLIEAIEFVWWPPKTPGDRPGRVRPFLAADRVVRNERTRPIRRATNNRTAAFWWLLLIALGLLLHFFF